MSSSDTATTADTAARFTVDDFTATLADSTASVRSVLLPPRGADGAAPSPGVGAPGAVDADAWVGALVKARNVIDAVLAQAVQVAKDAGVEKRFRSGSDARYLKGRHHMSDRVAKELLAAVRFTGTVRGMDEDFQLCAPETLDAFTTGSISAGHIAAIADATDRIPEARTEQVAEAFERALVQYSRHANPHAVKQEADAFLEVIGAKDTTDKDRRKRRGLFLGRQHTDGMSYLHGWLTPQARSWFETMTAVLGQPGMNNVDDMYSPRGTMGGDPAPASPEPPMSSEPTPSSEPPVPPEPSSSEPPVPPEPPSSSSAPSSSASTSSAPSVTSEPAGAPSASDPSAAAEESAVAEASAEDRGSAPPPAPPAAEPGRSESDDGGIGGSAASGSGVGDAGVGESTTPAPEQPVSGRGVDPEEVAAAAERDERSNSQRVHDAFAAACEYAGSSGALGRTFHGLPAHLILTATLDELESACGRAMTATGTRMSIAEMLTCAEVVHPVLVLFDRGGQPMFLGRGRRTASLDQRLALFARDRGCTRPGCDHGAFGAEAHHLVEWAAGGLTDVPNLALACKRDHRYVTDADTGLKTWMGRNGQPVWAANGPDPNHPEQAAPRTNSAHRPGEDLAAIFAIEAAESGLTRQPPPPSSSSPPPPSDPTPRTERRGAGGRREPGVGHRRRPETGPGTAATSSSPPGAG